MDPRTQVNTRDGRSELMKAKSSALKGEKVNFCPYGCENHELNEHGYCKHLVGFVAEGQNMMEVRELNPGPNCAERVGPKRAPIDKRKDTLVQVTTCYRVYRKNEFVKGYKEPEEELVDQASEA